MQLSRPYQFAGIYTTRGERDWGLFRHILEEHEEAAKPGWSRGAAIGACIRSITIKLRDFVMADQIIVHVFNSRHGGKRRQRFVADLARAIETAMPNQERLYLAETTDVIEKHPLISAALNSSTRLRELALVNDRIYFKDLEGFMAILPMGPTHLRSLALTDEKFTLQGSSSRNQASYLIENIMCRCASRLESFIWTSPCGTSF